MIWVWYFSILLEGMNAQTTTKRVMIRTRCAFSALSCTKTFNRLESWATSTSNARYLNIWLTEFKLRSDGSFMEKQIRMPLSMYLEFQDYKVLHLLINKRKNLWIWTIIISKALNLFKYPTTAWSKIFSCISTKLKSKEHTAIKLNMQSTSQTSS